jgi:hypothetical protein
VVEKASDDLLEIALRPRPQQSEPSKITCNCITLLFTFLFVAHSIGHVAQTVYYRHEDYELEQTNPFPPRKHVSFSQYEELGELHFFFPVCA